MTPYRLIDKYRIFRGMCYFHPQGRYRKGKARNETSSYTDFSSHSAYFSNLKMRTRCSSETSVLICQSAWQQSLQSHNRNLTSHTLGVTSPQPNSQNLWHKTPKLTCERKHHFHTPCWYWPTAPGEAEVSEPSSSHYMWEMMTTLATGCSRTQEGDSSLPGPSVPVNGFRTTNSMINSTGLI